MTWCVCVCIIVLLGTASQHFSMLGIPLRGTFITLGETKSKRKSRKEHVHRYSKIIILFGIYSVSCFQDHFQGVDTGSRAYIYIWLAWDDLFLSVFLICSYVSIIWMCLYPIRFAHPIGYPPIGRRVLWKESTFFIAEEFPLYIQSRLVRFDMLPSDKAYSILQYTVIRYYLVGGFNPSEKC